jgi:hypothetical protein
MLKPQRSKTMCRYWVLMVLVLSLLDGAVSAQSNQQEKLDHPDGSRGIQVGAGSTTDGRRYHSAWEEVHMQKLRVQVFGIRSMATAPARIRASIIRTASAAWLWGNGSSRRARFGACTTRTGLRVGRTISLASRMVPRASTTTSPLADLRMSVLDLLSLGYRCVERVPSSKTTHLVLARS